MNKNKKISGFIFLEILIAVALIGIVFITLLVVGFSAVNLSTSVQQQTQADSLTKEEFESIRSFRDGTKTTWGTTGLGSVSFGSANPYYTFLDASTNPAKWTLHAGTETTGIFTRKVVFDKVSRDPATQNIETVYNAAHNDADTVKATITVTWPTKTSQVVAYFTNWQK